MASIKICGITNQQDADKVCELGAHALGFVFYEKSPRYITPIDANRIVENLPPFIVPIALFVDASEGEVKNVIEGSHRWQIQFHGNETEGYCQSFGRSYIKALRVKDGCDIMAQINQYPSASAILLDTYKAGIPGGTGESFNWNLVPENSPKPIILAGGLTPDNVGSAIKTVKPYAVDVSGGVELSKGIKDHKKIELFINGAKS